MKGLPPFPEDYFAKFSEKPVVLKPFDARSMQVGQSLVVRLRKMLEKFAVRVVHRGSTAFGIVGKGEIEIGVYPKSADWRAVLRMLTRYFGVPGNVEKDYARFNTTADGFDTEVIVLRGQAAEVDLKLTRYLGSHPTLLQEYERVKREAAYSKREYQRAKDRFLRKVVAIIPED